jgi:putative OPT family oligopeptide transporter
VAEQHDRRILRTGPYPELTLTAVIVGYGLGILITISIGYASLILGFSIEGSELAAILGFGILRGLLGRNSIVENNINQTIASAVNAASSGLMFTVPALFILGHGDFDPVMMVFACIAGGILGIAFVIPLRKQMIDFERLTYPGGTAVATILKSPGAGVRKALLLLVGIAISAAAHFASQYTDVKQWDLGAVLGLPEYMNGVWSISLMTVGVGFIAGRGGISFIIGGYVCYWVLAPVLNGMGLLPAVETFRSPRTEMPEYLRTVLFRPVGIGMLIGGALTGILLAFPLIVSAVRSMQSAARLKTKHSKDEMPIHLLYVGVAGATVLLFVTALVSVKEIGAVRAAIMALLGTAWIWAAGVILSECIGRTNWSPLSGMTLIAVTILILVARQAGDAAAIVASIMVGAAACVAMSQATDLMQDLKTGYLVGASPKRQQIGQLLATWLGPIVVMALVFVLHKAYGFAGEAGAGEQALPAPQGNALAATIKGILGGQVPVEKYLAGAGLGALLSASGIGGLGILVGLGFYLSFDIVLTYTIGTVLRIVVDWRKGVRFCEEVGIPVAAGLIVGEALVGVGFALFRVFKGMAS